MSAEFCKFLKLHQTILLFCHTIHNSFGVTIVTLVGRMYIPVFKYVWRYKIKIVEEMLYEINEYCQYAKNVTP